MDKQNVVYPYNKVVLCNKEKPTDTLENIMNQNIMPSERSQKQKSS